MPPLRIRPFILKAQPSHEIGRLADVAQPDREAILGLRRLPIVEDAHIRLEVKALVMIDQGDPGVKQFPFLDIVVEFAQGFELEPRDLKPADDTDLLPVAQDILVPRIHAPIPTHRKKERVGVGIDAGPEPQVRKSPGIGAVSRRDVEAVLAARIEPHIA